ncbi:hypothetical protein BCR33DRAFT_767451 [Rhizoclosmatium globosum]|uniref:Bromo domain-containing protein n=1 Tax=Rhizoclosmatium globosum TaxID=329046 RepID=A0A1Y2C3S3_9FUNG|nr:hypothetical protein BCR33DRAFT_767451 [Rhizoclosmatium globosum]|eukprot:ORY41606.1 hypothetical protein BCR33DRAFT_767451 [Rhizoclosmatium globosum]
MQAPIVIKPKEAEEDQADDAVTGTADSMDYDYDDYEPIDPKNVKFSDLFAPKLRIVKPAVNKKLFKKPPQRNNTWVLSRNDIDVFFGRIQQQKDTESWGIYRGRRWKDDIEEREIFATKTVPSSLDPVVLDNWEDKIVWDDEDIAAEKLENDPREEHARLLIRNTALDREDWTDAIIWDDDENYVPPPLVINDPTIVNDLKDWGYGANPSTVTKSIINTLFPVDKFNLSNDQFYVNARKHEEVRQTSGNAILKHARAAIEMMWPHYKTQLNTQELRNFHRPPIKFTAGEQITFSRVKGAKKKKDVDPIQDYMNLSLKDSTNYVLLEYTEEYPPILSNFGMGTLLQNFYRKLDEKDLTMPKLEIGQHSPLENIDASPFNNFGDVAPGDVIQGITNNLIRAPVFRHEIPPTDFLLIRYTHNGKTKYYLRDCPYLFAVGQTYPQQEVPRPQSRKVLNLCKFRLHSIAFRLMLQNPNQRLWYPKLQKYYVGQVESVVRQRLREVCQNWKKGENTGWYKIKQSKMMPTEEELQKIITPEWCCLLETAFAGEQRLKDIGYANLDLSEAPGGEEDEKEDKEENLEENSTDLEIQMAPWIWTKNFVMTISGKGMVQLYGGGDPTGCGEGFSFIRQSMKEMFYREGEAPPPSALKTPKNLVRFSYSEQQVVYKEEIRRIWNAQFKRLSSKKAPELQTDEELGDEDDMEEDKADGSGNKQAVAVKPKDDDTMSIAASAVSNAVKSNRRLVIKRYVKLSDGKLGGKHQVQIREQALAASAPPPEDDGKKSRKKKLPDTIITENTPAFPVRHDSSSSQPGLKLKFNLSSMEQKPKPPPTPAGELNAIFDMVVTTFINLPESGAFCFPVSREIFPDYHTLVKTPISLEEIKTKCANATYKSAEQFTSDITLIYENSALYNGVDHALTKIAHHFVTKTHKQLLQFHSEIMRLETEIMQAGSSSVLLHSQCNPQVKV